MLSIWFCGDISKNISTYIILRRKDVKQVKGGTKILSNMENLLKHVMRGEFIENRNDLVLNFWSARNVMAFYRGLRLFFAFPCLAYDKRRCYDTMSWKTHFNILIKRKGTLSVEK